ncbi:hypothetical protein J7E25_07095 [Agromyces sp. ISL-38]|uniref:hypothetical protein n=1 Tax=Agromyces sp. ISL-38 TaxID=2819107 RepID=UPI001BED3877|nr:hypothetical protein [Agromyces sp. ISL-38]MBT2498858.1 hypothetical protein [Agromyces sp. ISL-38]MBT2516457.1 hypothetical protein [Streptomyces sp. ISL-90]
MTSLLRTARLNERARPFLVLAREITVVAGQTIFSIAALGTCAFVIILASDQPYEDMLSMVGWAFWSVLAAVITTALMIIIGLSLRLLPVLRRWWRANGEVMLAGTLVGLGLIVVAFIMGTPRRVEEPFEQEFVVFEPNGWLLLTGWLVFAFTCSHLLWPRRWTRAAKRTYAAIFVRPA